LQVPEEERKEDTMPTITAKDRARIYYKDWGDEDQIVPIGTVLMTKIVSGALLTVYEGGHHGRPTTNEDAFNADPPFLRGEPAQGAVEQESHVHA
jgi:hypothetical protein